jgi:hypothetical protein
LACPVSIKQRVLPSDQRPRSFVTLVSMLLPTETIETARIRRIAGLTGDRTALVTTRPFRAPHHTISDVGLIGGGHVPRPGDSTGEPQTRRAQTRS